MSGYTDVGSWFEVINSRLRSFGLQGPCTLLVRNRYVGNPWDKLLIEFGSGAKRWVRRENLKLISPNYGGSK